MNFLELQNEVRDLINFTSGTTDQDYTTAQVQKAINVRYALEVLIGQQHGKRTWFQKFFEFTWPASAETVTIPTNINQAQVLKFEDITNRDPGDPLPASIFWKDNQTLQWGSTSPAQDTTIRATYLARPAEMVNDSDEPSLISPEHHMLLVWSSAIYLRQKADENAPGAWLEQLHEDRLTYWKALSRGRPLAGGGPAAYYDVLVSGAQVDQDGSSIGQDNDD